MSKYEQIRNRLPSLYRPQEGEQGLLVRLLQAIGQSLDQVDVEAAAVLQAHWFDYADRALYDAFFQRRRQLQGQPPPPPKAPELLAFPYIDDLAYLSGLLSLFPWQEPTPETAEAFRLRVHRTVTLYREGLGTLSALRRMVELQLPVDLGAPPAQRDRPFWLEEGVAGSETIMPAKPQGPPTDLVGPLMRWSVPQSGLRAVAPTLYVQGVTPEPDQVEATVSPLIERYGGAGQPLGIAYLGTLAPGQTLRLRPAFTSWLGTSTGLERADAAMNPTADGPWQAVTDGPSGEGVAMVQAEDASLWVALNADGIGRLWRYDGRTWTETLTDLAPIADLCTLGQDLLIGTDSGLLRLPLFPPAGTELTPESLSDAAVYGVQVVAGQVWLGTATGAFTLAADNRLVPTALSDVAVYAVHIDPSGAQFFGTERGLLHHQPGVNEWYWYHGEVRTEQRPEWEPFDPTESLPAAGAGFLPTVRSIARSGDGWLWLGTDRGLARYGARPVRGLTTETILQAFPDMTTGRVSTFKIDGRGLLWIGCDRTLLRYDGHRLWQYQNGQAQPLGLADQIYPSDSDPLPRDAWRYSPSRDAWERFTPLGTDLELRTTAAEAVKAIAWSDGIRADVGDWDGDQFTPDPNAADPTPQLRMRYKPRPTEVRDGGLLAVPRLPVGPSTWRYLQVETDPPSASEERPAWSREGRLLGTAPGVDPESGRFDLAEPPPSDFDASLFAFLPAARIWFSWQPIQPASVLVRLQRRQPDEVLDPIILQRVWRGLQQVRPAAVQVQLALGEQLIPAPEP